jgi:hypothetical protein
MQVTRRSLAWSGRDKREVIPGDQPLRRVVAAIPSGSNTVA